MGLGVFVEASISRPFGWLGGLHKGYFGHMGPSKVPRHVESPRNTAKPPVGQGTEAALLFVVQLEGC